MGIELTDILANMPYKTEHILVAGISWNTHTHEVANRAAYCEQQFGKAGRNSWQFVGGHFYFKHQIDYLAYILRWQ